MLGIGCCGKCFSSAQGPVLNYLFWPAVSACEIYLHSSGAVLAIPTEHNAVFICCLLLSTFVARCDDRGG